MWEYFKNNVKLVYLLPHSSHILQPLNLSCFSVIKSRYRGQITNLARYKDSAPIKKIRFIQYYHKARTEGLTGSIIQSGWRAAGIYPWDPRKVIRSSQVTQNHAANLSIIPTTSQTHQSQKRRLSTSLPITTPQNKH
jgi:DDE superfamily endonuclease